VSPIAYSRRGTAGQAKAVRRSRFELARNAKVDDESSLVGYGWQATTSSTSFPYPRQAA
jgi:hypothetical protein